MTNNYDYYLNLFHSPVPDFTDNIPIVLPNGEEFNLKITTVNKEGLESLEASGLYSQFEKNWEEHYGDFVMSSVLGPTRYMWTVLKQDEDCGIVTFYMDKKYSKLAEHILQDLGELIRAHSISNISKPMSGEA